MYNKEAVIEAILNKTISNNENAQHIKGIKVLNSVFVSFYEVVW